MVHQLAVMLLACAVMLLAQYYRDSNSTDLPVFFKILKIPGITENDGKCSL